MNAKPVDMRKMLLTAFFLVVCASGLVAASTVSREFGSDTVLPGEDLAVTLRVSIDGDETFYIIDELVPEGWTIKEPGTGSSEHAGHLKWIVIQDAGNGDYSYILTAPATEGTTVFDGSYIIEGMLGEGKITGQSQVSVSAQMAQPQDYTLAVIAIVAIIAAATVLALFSRKNKGKK
jgi:hypothetical protein